MWNKFKSWATGKNKQQKPRLEDVTGQVARARGVTGAEHEPDPEDAESEEGSEEAIAGESITQQQPGQSPQPQQQPTTTTQQQQAGRQFSDATDQQSLEDEARDTFDPHTHTKLSQQSVDDYELLMVVGKGSFGKVMQVRKKDTGKIYAMKVLKKKALIQRKQVAHTQTERKVLARIDHPFIVSLRYAFQTSTKLYMILDFFNGGELFFHLKNEGRFAESRAKFYAAQIVLSLECLHKRDIVYRDLKPENILLDQDGNIRITDFGLSKESMNSLSLTHTFCGTPEYLAPEVLQGTGHGKAVDWWSFGTLLYEMLTGLPPFYNQNLNVMYDKILHASIPFPSSLSPEARSLFIGLLQRDPAKRLGSGPNDAEDIKSHPFFADTDWEALYRLEVTPPFKPSVQDEFDVSNVDREFTDEMPADTPVQGGKSVLAGKAAFPNFTYEGSSVGEQLTMGGNNFDECEGS